MSNDRTLEETAERLAGLSFDRAEAEYLAGDISSVEWAAYVMVWRYSAPKFSRTGQWAERVIVTNEHRALAEAMGYWLLTGPDGRTVFTVRTDSECARPDGYPCLGPASWLERHRKTRYRRTVCVGHYGISPEWEGIEPAGRATRVDIGAELERRTR